MYLDIIISVEKIKRLNWKKFARTFWKHTTIPNCLTVGAALAVLIDAVFILFGFINRYTFWALEIGFCVDGIDGTIAHWLKKVSREGAGLDRGADKLKYLIVVVLMACFAQIFIAGASENEKLQAVIMTLSLTLLELSLMLMGIWGARRGLPIESTEAGKAKMFFEYNLMTWIVIVIHGYQPYFQFLFDFPLDSNNSLRLTLFLLFVSNMLAIASIKSYWDKYERELKVHLATLRYKSFLRLNYVFRIFI